WRHYHDLSHRRRGDRYVPDGNVSGCGCRDGVHVFQLNSAAWLELVLVDPQDRGLSDRGQRHVVQKDHIYAVNFGKSARLLQIIGLDFNTHVWSLLTKLLNSISKTGKPSERG